MPKRITIHPEPDASEEIDSKWLGNMIRHLRTSHGITLQDAAGLCNLSKQTYNDIELGKGTVSVNSLFNVLTMFKIKLSASHQKFVHDW